jgi:hypothetical protein
MSLSQRRVEAGLERINRVLGGGGPNMGFQAVTPHDIDAGIEQSGDVVGDGDVFVDPVLAAGSTSIMMSTSLSGRASSRAQEPNNAACRTPRSRSAAWFSRNRVMMFLRSMRLYIAWKAFAARR